MQGACKYWRLHGCPYGDLFLQGGHHCPWTLGAAMPLRSCGAAAVRSYGHLCSSVPVRGECRSDGTRKLGSWELSFWPSGMPSRVSHLPQQPSNQQKPVIGSSTTGRFVIGS